MTAVVVRWDSARGFGKIWGRHRTNYFVHREALCDLFDLSTGAHVEFEATESARGPRAESVTPIEARASGRR